MPSIYELPPLPLTVESSRTVITLFDAFIEAVEERAATTERVEFERLTDQIHALTECLQLLAERAQEQARST